MHSYHKHAVIGSLLLILDPGLHPQSHVITVISYYACDIPYRTNVWREKSLAKMLQMSIWQKKFGEPAVYKEAIQGTWIL